MDPRAWVDKITFSDDTTLELSSDDIVVIVGPNNSGKSAALRGIRDRFTGQGPTNPVVLEVVVERLGDGEELLQWLERTTKKQLQPSQDHTYEAFGVGVHRSQAVGIWDSPNHPLGNIARFFCHLLTADERLQAANPAQSIAIARESPHNPIHFLQRDDGLEATLSNQFRRAFGEDLVLHRNAGNQVPLHVGQKPELHADEDRVSLTYIERLEQLPAIQTQGDGMRSFAGVLLFTSVGRQTTLLIDEPEAFLHPPQARQLGRMMVSEKPSDRQLFIATHSGDVLRGILDSGSSTVRVLRLRRVGPVNVARQLDNSSIAELWSDPLLRYSNILDGLFHERVVLCESDSDCRFYAAVMDALYETSGAAERRPDIMFTHCGGKDRLPLVIGALRELEVPLTIVADFDVLNAEQPLRRIVESAGHEWSDVAPDWKAVKYSIDSKKPELATEEVRKEIETIFEQTSDTILTNEARDKIRSILRRSSPWSTVKSTGKSFVPSGSPTQACDRLLAALANIGILVVPVGELEGFARSIGGHGPAWVNEVLKKNLSNDAELSEARAFVSHIVQEES